MSTLAHECRPLLAWARNAGDATVELACAEHPDPSRGAGGARIVRLPGCLADLEAHVPLEVLTLGPRAVVLRLDGCARAAEARAQHAPTVALTDALAGDHRVVVAEIRTGQRRQPVLDARHPPVSRRRALLLLPVDDGDPLPDETATPHERLRRAARALAGSAVPDGVSGPGLLLAAASCTASGVCVRACPEDALSLAPDGAATVLRLDPGRCSGCGRCIAVCDQHALTFTGRAPWTAVLQSEPTVLARVPTRTCTRCGVRFGADARGAACGPDRHEVDLCPVCVFRSAHPFGSSLPPEVLAKLPRDVAARIGGVAG